MMFLLAAVAMAIPKRYPGFLWGSDDAQVNIELFCDPLCPDCRDTWPALLTILGRYPTQVNARVQLLDLPYHTWSYYAIRAIYALNSTEIAKRVIDALYSDGDLDKFSNTALLRVPEAQIAEQFANYVTQKFHVDKTRFLANFANTAIVSDAAGTFGWAASHMIDETPTVKINGALTALGPSSTILDWINIIKGLIG
jgi:hypothetical protein